MRLISAPASDWASSGPPGAQTSSQMFTATGTPWITKTGLSDPGWKYRFSSKTP